MKWSLPFLEIMIKKYQDPTEADKLLKLQKELDEINKVMSKNIDEVRRYIGFIDC